MVDLNYDYVIVGEDSDGGVLAARLGENPAVPRCACLILQRQTSPVMQSNLQGTSL
jgi:hypothetical protein